MNRSPLRIIIGLLASAGLVLGSAGMAQAIVPAGGMGQPTLHNAGKPIWGTLQNLPGIGATEFTYVGPTMAPTIEAYYAGQHAADLKAMAKKARQFLRAQLEQRCGGDPRACKAMVVFDIDETLFNNYSYWAAQTPPFSLDDTAWETYVADCDASVNGPVFNFYRLAQDTGVKVAVITGRPDSQSAITKGCLREKGITGWTAYIGKPDNSTQTASVFKAQARASLQKKGFTILVSVGDQISDMAGGHLGGGIWLPNPMYYIP